VPALFFFPIKPVSGFFEMREAIAVLLAGFVLVGVFGCGGTAKPDPKAAAAAKVVNPPDPPETTFKNKRR